jgi:thioredoxin-related protein
MDSVKKNKGHKMVRSFLFVCALLTFSSLATLAQTDTGSPQWQGWEDGVRTTQGSGKYMLVDVYTDWCGWCKKLDQEVYAHPEVQQLLASNFVTVKLNAESTNLIKNGTNQFTEQELAKMLDVKGYPAILVYDKKFQLVSRLSGYHEPKEFIRYLKYISGKHYTQYTFQDYLQKVHDDQ